MTQINPNKIKEINELYQKLNKELLNLNPNNLKEIILGNYDPFSYSQEIYPDIQYYCLSSIYNLETFTQIFNSSGENNKKYFLIDLLINKENILAKSVLKMKNLININKLSNLLLNIYSYKIRREDAKKKIFENELDFIVKTFNEMRSIKITKEKFNKEYIEPFIQSRRELKEEVQQFRCRDLNNNIKEIKINSPLSFFLVDDGDIDGGMVLSSIYELFIEWQNKFIETIISNNKFNGILNSYCSQLSMEIKVQDAIENEIICINDNIYEIFNDLIRTTSMRNIFGVNDKKINYKNYNKIIYNYELIEEELAKIILPGLKKFKTGTIKFINYMYEGFRGEYSSILVDYNAKYIKKDLNNEEISCINKFLKTTKGNKKIYSDIYFSIQILMNEILKENYNQNYLIFNIIEMLPKYIILNQELIKLIKNNYNSYKNHKSFTVNSLVSFFEYFEYLCWEDIKKYINYDYNFPLDDKIKNEIISYFEKNKNKKNNIVNKNNLSSAIRKFISRYIIGTRQSVEIKSDIELSLYIIKDDLWPKIIIDKEELLKKEINKILNEKVKIGHIYNLYILLNGDDNQFEKKEIEKNNIKNTDTKNTNIIIKRNLDNNEAIEDIPRKNCEKKQIFKIEVKKEKKRFIKEENNNNNENNIYNNTTKISNNGNKELNPKVASITFENKCICQDNCLSSCIIY